MSWTLFKVNVLKSMISGQFSKDPDSFAEFYANEYDQCIKRGGDMLYGVPIINGNVKGMADVIKRALKKGTDSDGENFNILQEIYPSAFDAYWMGAEMAPIPNPLLKPLGWQMTPPAPGTIMNIGPSPISLAASTAKHKAEVEVLKALEDELKSKTINIPLPAPLPALTVNVYETIQKIQNKEELAPEVKNHPAILAGKEIVAKLKEAKKKKPSIGSQFKPSIKFPFPELPKRKDLIEKAKSKLIEEATAQIKEKLTPPIQEKVLQPIIGPIQIAVELSKSIPSPKPTKEQIKEFVVDTANGVKPKIDLPDINIPKIPTKEELEKQIENALPTKEQLTAMAFDMIKDKIPNIPNIWFIPPTIALTPPTNILLDPFVNVAKVHLMGTAGTMNVMAQYPPPAPPAPAIISWSGYNVIG
jgi:hypothetical protein